MFLGKVMGNLVATVKITEHQGEKLMLVQKIDNEGVPQGPVYVTLDKAGAGVGDYVLFTAEGGAAAMIAKGSKTNCAIAGVLDRLPALNR